MRFPGSWPPGEYPGKAEDGVLVMRSGDTAKAVDEFNGGAYTGIVVNSEHGARGLENLNFLLEMDPSKLLNVSVSSARIEDDTAVERLTGLTSLGIMTGSRRRLKLDGHAQLAELSLDGDRVPKAGLAHLPLNFLFVMSYQASDWSQLPETLQYAKLIWRRLESLKGLERLKLRQLVLAYSRRVVDWSSLSSQTSLEVLELTSIPIRSLAWLPSLTDLRTLWLDNCKEITGWTELIRASHSLDFLALASLSVNGETVITDAPSPEQVDALCRSINRKGHQASRS